MDRELWILLLTEWGEGSRERRQAVLQQILSLQMRERLLRQAEALALQALEEQCRRSRRELCRLSEERLRRLLHTPPERR